MRADFKSVITNSSTTLCCSPAARCKSSGAATPYRDKAQSLGLAGEVQQREKGFRKLKGLCVIPMIIVGLEC